MKNMKWACALGALIGLVGCNSSGTQTPLGVASGTTVGGRSLDGTYAQTCQTDLSTQTSGTVQMTFKGSTVQSEIDVYGDEACKDLQIKVEISGTFSTGAEVASGSNTYTIDYTANVTTLTDFDPAGVADDNQEAECGYTNWAIGVPQNVATTACNDGYFIAQARYSIVKLEGVNLYLGEDSSGPIGDSPEDRLENLSSTALVRQP